MELCIVSIGYSLTNNQPFTIRCGKWDCEYCAILNAADWTRRIRAGVIGLMKKYDVWFWTLTEPSSVRDARAGLRLLPRQWDTLRKIYQRWAKENSLPSSYCAAVEPHEGRGGVPHLHLLWLAPGSSGLRRDWARRAGFGYIHHASRVEDLSGVGYLAKYQGKGTGSWPKHFRRVRVSRDWPSFDVGGGLGQCIIKQPGESLRAFSLRLAYITGEEPSVIELGILDLLDGHRL